MGYMIAGIDVHKKMFAVVAADASETELRFERRRFGSTAPEVEKLARWLSEREVVEIVMESTAQYWKPLWLALEQRFRLHLAQAHSNRGPKGRKWDFADAERLIRRLIAGELILSFVPDAEQREMRMLARKRVQLTRQRVRAYSQLECLLEESRIKLSSLISDLLGASGRRILRALAQGESDPARLAELGDDRLHCTREQLTDALRGPMSAIQRELLSMQLEQIELIDKQIEQTLRLTTEVIKQYQEAVTRLSEVPGLAVIAAQQIIAEAGPSAAAFPSGAQFASWIGCCPGSEQSDQVNRSARSPKGNKYLRALFSQAAHAAVKAKDTRFQTVFHRLLPRLGYNKAIWAVARHMALVVWKILHEGVRYEERGQQPSPQTAKRRAQRLIHQLRRLGYAVEIKATVVPAGA